MSEELESIQNPDLKNFGSMPPWEWPEDAMTTLLGILRDRSVAESDRVLAAEFAGEYIVVNDEAVEALLGVLADGSEPEALRAQAAISLGPALEAGDTDGFDDPEDVPIGEETFTKTIETLERLYKEPSVPKLVRRRIFEAAVRAPQEWQREAALAAYADADEDWKLTAVFSMAFLHGFEPQILDALNSDDMDILSEAVHAAGNWNMEDAWPRIKELLLSDQTDRTVLMAAIEAAPFTGRGDANDLLLEFCENKDEELAEAATESMSMLQVILNEGDEEELR